MYALLLGAALAGSALDRCRTPHCMCELQTETVAGQAVMEIRFSEDSDQLSYRAEQRLQQWEGPAVIIATTDGCGTTEHNQDLAARRAAAVKDLLPQASTWPLGETTTQHDPAHRRTLIVTPRSRILQLLAANPADYYVLDGSGSMSSHWSDVRQFPFPKGSKVYAAKTYDCQPGTRVSRFRPEGPTEIWYPLWYTVELAEPNTVIMLVSDMRSRVPLSPQAEALINSNAKAKNIQIKYIKY